MWHGSISADPVALAHSAACWGLGAMRTEQNRPTKSRYWALLSPSIQFSGPVQFPIPHHARPRHGAHTSVLPHAAPAAVPLDGMPRPGPPSPPLSASLFNSLIASRARAGRVVDAVALLTRMLAAGVAPTAFTFAPILSAPCLDARCASQLHARVLQGGMLHGEPYTATALLGFFGRSGRFDDALKVFAETAVRSVVTWNCLIASFMRFGRADDAVFWFRELVRSGDELSDGSLVAVLPAFGSPEQMRILGHRFDSSDTYVDNMLLDMYAKCGRIEDCLKIFEEMEDRNLISWTAVVSGLGLNGFSRKALAWFEAMEKDGFKPDKVAILAVLSACRHGRLVQQGMKIFKNMRADYSVEAEMEHYICVVDMLCKCGQLKEAEAVIRDMPFRPSTVIWRTFLQGCKTYGVMEAQVFS
ncbi:hypothetical protein QOZ80_1BG0083720 [Eleusine coracana subsp. coracana]|nr:hypothetical protein QOZ80_1BG0083720 [Eleusine coracana subsp. coracana]